jgi:hypothetical protein
MSVGPIFTSRKSEDFISHELGADFEPVSSHIRGFQFRLLYKTSGHAVIWVQRHAGFETVMGMPPLGRNVIVAWGVALGPL